MREHILKLEAISKQLEPSPEKRADWNKGVQNYADDFLNKING